MTAQRRVVALFILTANDTPLVPPRQMGGAVGVLFEATCDNLVRFDQPG